QVVVDGGAVRRVVAEREIVVRRGRGREGAEAIGRTRREEVRVRVQHLRRQIAQRRYVVENPRAAAVGGNHEIVELLLHGDPVDRRVRQVELQRLPVLTVVE